MGLRFVPDYQRVLDGLSDGEKLEAKRALEQYQKHRLLDPIQFYVPNVGTQDEFHLAIHKYLTRAFMGGNRAGKTTGGILDDLIQACPRHKLPEHLLPYKKYDCPFYCRIVIPDLKRHLNDVVLQKLREWTPKHMLRNGLFDSSYSKADYQLSFECGCRFDLMSFEQDVDKFGGSALHRCHYDEEPPEEIREEGLVRLIDFEGDEVFTMTPLKGMSWMYDGILEASRTDPDIYVKVVDMDDNPHLPEAGKQKALKGMSDQKREARKKGRMVHFAGMVYPRFEDALINEPDRRLVGSLEIVVGIDPGVRSTAASFLGFDRDNAAILFDELELHSVSTPQVCEALRSKLREWGLEEKGVQFVIDPAARQRTLTTAVAVVTSYYMEGIYPADGQNDVEGGIRIIESRIDQGALQICETCTYHLWSARRYRRKLHEESGNWVVVKDDKEHPMDSLRYGITYRPWEITDTKPDTLKERMNRYKTVEGVAFPPSATRPGGGQKPLLIP